MMKTLSDLPKQSKYMPVSPFFMGLFECQLKEVRLTQEWLDSQYLKQRSMKVNQ